MIIPSYREGEAAFDSRVFGLVIRVLQRAARQKGLLTLVESNSSKLLPVVYK